MTENTRGVDPGGAGETPETTGGPAPDDRIEARLRAVERAITETDVPVAGLADDAAAATERERLASRLDDIEERVAELEAATQAIRGYAGAVRAVNREVERRADLALARATAAAGAGVGAEGADGAETDPEFEGGGDRARAIDEPSTRESAADSATHESAADPTLDESADDEAVGYAVPTESALDAALPDDRRRSDDRTRSADTAATRTPAAAEATARESVSDDGSWAVEALDRLRESL